MVSYTLKHKTNTNIIHTTFLINLNKKPFMHNKINDTTVEIEHVTTMNNKLKPTHYISQIVVHKNMFLQHKIVQQTNPQVVAMHIKFLQINT